jgi:cyanophycinase
MLSSADLRRLLLGVAMLAGVAIASAQEPAPTWRSRYHSRGIAGALLLCGADVSPQETAEALRELRPDAPVSIAVIGGGESIGPLAAAASHCSPVGELRWGRTASDLTPPTAPPKDLTFWVHAEPGVDLGGITESPLGRTVLRHVSSGGLLVLSGAAAGGPWWTPHNGSEDSADGTTAGNRHVDSLLPGVALFTGDGVEEGDDVVPSPPAGLVGLRLRADAMLLVRGRRLLGVGGREVAATLHLAAGAERDAAVVSVGRGQPADLTMLRRAAELRQQPSLLPSTPVVPEVPRGHLLIVGGGGLTDEMVQTFVDRAGGREACIVVVPTAEESPRLVDRSDVRRFLDAGAGRVVVLHPSEGADETQAEWLAPLREATGVWFGGGRQWRFLDAYEGTPFVTLCQGVLERGGILGGSSAGATIQGAYLVRGHPLGNTVMMAEGYERGFGFLPGTAIDQHFTERGRQGDLELVKRTFPQLVCLGIDESTALIVSGSRGRVLGVGTVAIYDRFPDDSPEAGGLLERTLLRSGEIYDFRTRRIVTAAGMD